MSILSVYLLELFIEMVLMVDVSDGLDDIIIKIIVLMYSKNYYYL